MSQTLNTDLYHDNHTFYDLIDEYAYTYTAWYVYNFPCATYLKYLCSLDLR